MKFEALFKEVEFSLRDEIVLLNIFQKNKNRYLKTLDLIVSRFDSKSSLKNLDFGCGNPYLVFLLDRLGFEVVGYEPYLDDINKKCIKLLNINHLIISKPNNEKYNLILLIDVIEHVPIISQLFHSISLFTYNDSTLFFSTPNVMRIEMWFLFLIRKQGHPQHIDIFLNNKDLYTNHQREYTNDELIYTSKFFGFEEILYNNCLDTLPDFKLLQKNHLVQNKKIYRKSRLIFFFNFLKLLFPKSFNNNLFLIVRRIPK